MRDFLPSRMIHRQHVIHTLRSVFERFGFEPLETPSVEYADTLTGKYGEEADKLIYQFEDRGGRQIGLRYDLTVPLARVVALYPELVKPFKRYQISPVWRAEKPQKGRYREFYQCDVDTAGSYDMLADAEIIAVADFALRELGFTSYRIKINDRKVLAALGQHAGVPADKFASLCRAIDKLEKIGEAEVRAELARAEIAPEAIDLVFDLILLQGESAELLAQLRDRLGGNPVGLEGIAELEKVVTYLTELGVAPEHYQIDFAMVRGLDYYTGPIFEAVVTGLKLGSICGGGRYDGLVGMFSSQAVPAVGITMGLDRIVDALDELAGQDASQRQTQTEVLVTIFGPETRAASLQLVSELRRAGINAEIFLGSEKLQNQLRYANRKGIPKVAILGGNEIGRNEVVMKDLASGQQQAVARADLVATLRG